MPTYEYGCDACGFGFEKEQRITEKPVKKCPNCGKMKARRMITGGTGFILKGSGWYSDLYSSPKPDSGKSDGDSDSSTAESSKAESSKAEGSGESTNEKSTSEKSSSDKSASKTEPDKKPTKGKSKKKAS